MATRSLLDRAMQLGRPRVVTAFAPPPVPIAPDVWSLERRLRMPLGAVLPNRTTILRLASGGLLVVSPPPVAPGGFEHLDALGAVEEVLLPNSFHYLYGAEFLARYPGACLRMAPGLHARIAGLPAGDELTEATPNPWQGAIEHSILATERGLSEVALFHRPSATLVLTDVAFHMVRFDRPLDRVFWRLFGVPAGFGPSRTARLFLLRDDAAAPFLDRVRAWPFRRVLVAHGEPLEHDAAGVFARAFQALPALA
jgi:hypothetical protein